MGSSTREDAAVKAVRGAYRDGALWLLHVLRFDGRLNPGCPELSEENKAEIRKLRSRLHPESPSNARPETEPKA